MQTERERDKERKDEQQQRNSEGRESGDEKSRKTTKCDNGGRDVIGL